MTPGEESGVPGIATVSAYCCQKYVDTYWLLKMAARVVQSTLWEMHNRESDPADLSTNEAAASAVHPRHDETGVTEVSCACVLLPVTSLLKGRPNETAPRVPFKCHAGVQETMLRYKCYFEWCHSVKLAALNYCRPFDAVYIPAVLSTHIIMLQIPHPGPDIANNAAQKHKQQRLVMMTQHSGIRKSLDVFFLMARAQLFFYSCAVKVFLFCHQRGSR